MLLQVVADTGNVGGHFVTVGETDTGDLTQSGVRLLRSRGTHSGADAALLGRRLVGLAVLQSVQAFLHGRRGGLVGHLLSSLTDKLVKCGHDFPPFLKKMLSCGRAPTRFLILTDCTRIVKKIL